VLSVAFSPDGKRLASASVDQSVKVWDTATGQESISLRGHSGRVWAVAFSPDGSRLASASEDQTVKVWDATRLTPKVRAERDALALLDFLFARPLPKADVLERLADSPTVPPEVRQRALALAERFREETDPKKYHDAAWPVIRHPYANVFTCQVALAQASAACRQSPGNAAHRPALGVAQYRLGRFQKGRHAEALATLARCDQARPATLAFLAMAQQQLGQTDRAGAALARLRETMKEPAWAADAEARGFLGEAVELIEGRAARPGP
jgi:hypothetical protein